MFFLLFLIIILRFRNSKCSETSSSSENTPSTSNRELPQTKVVAKHNLKHSVSFNPAKGMVRNHCFDNDGIGDDDL